MDPLAFFFSLSAPLLSGLSSHKFNSICIINYLHSEEHCRLGKRPTFLSSVFCFPFPLSGQLFPSLSLLALAPTDKPSKDIELVLYF